MKAIFRRWRSAPLLVVLLAAGCATVTPPQPQPQPRIGVQLWSVKDELRQDFDGTLVKLAALGFDGVEFAGEFGARGKDPHALNAFLRKHGLACAGAHVTLDQLAPERFVATTAFYQAAGCSALIVPADERAATAAGMVPLAHELTALAGKLAPLGLRIGYHNHRAEMAGADGHTPWDVLARTTPAGVILQQDVGWTKVAGKNPIAFIERYPGRSFSLHFKAKHAVGSGGVPIIGQDEVDWAALAAAARHPGRAQWLIVEQEEYPAGMGQVEAVAASMRGLRAALGTR